MSKFDAAAWIDAVEAIRGISLCLSREINKDPGPELHLYSLQVEDGMTDDGQRQFDELRRKCMPRMVLRASRPSSCVVARWSGHRDEAVQVVGRVGSSWEERED